MVLLAGWLPVSLLARTTAMIPDTDADQHVGQKATVEGVVIAIPNSGKGNTFIKFGRQVSPSNLHRLDPK